MLGESVIEVTSYNFTYHSKKKLECTKHTHTHTYSIYIGRIFLKTFVIALYYRDILGTDTKPMLLRGEAGGLERNLYAGKLA